MLAPRLAVLLACLGWSSTLPVEAANSTWQTWGPYRPNLYFGVRPRIPESLLMGLMWASAKDQSSMLKTLRDTCEQDDGMEGYGWTIYDTRVGGSQTIHDKELGIDLSTDFIKTDNGESWAVRVTGTPRPDAPGNAKTAVVFHVAIEQATEDDSRSLRCDNENRIRHTTKRDTTATCYGKIPSLGSFELKVTGGSQNDGTNTVVVRSLRVPEAKIWQAKASFMDHVKNLGDAPTTGEGTGPANMHFFEMNFEGPFEAIFAYNDRESEPLDSTYPEKNLDRFRSSFPNQVEKVFPRASAFAHEKYTHFAQALVSNLLGGLGFFHGDSKVDTSHAREYDETELKFWVGAEAAMARASITTAEPSSLFSFTPSRPFFPRGFLWDEGFHLLPVLEWDLDLAVSVLRSWLGAMDKDGWIAREQILGPESRSKVPEKFQVQYPHHANPPTLSLLIPILISKFDKPSTYYGHPSTYVSSPHEGLNLMKDIYPLLHRHYQWFRRTQAGNFNGTWPRPDDTIAGEGYRWRGRTPKHTLSSGLDDYPRANPPHPGELHVDALAWVGASANALKQVAAYLGEPEDVALYERHLESVKRNLDVLHWDATDHAYCDATVELDANQQVERYRRVCRLGYISLFPLILGLMDAEHPNLPSILDLLSDPAQLWSPHGIRSLSKADADYGKGENYWRGAIWMNLNVLAVLRLRDIGTQGEGPVQARALSLAADLRERLVNTVFNSWEKTGFVWEQYSDKTGEGSHSRAFTGWTACVVLLMGLDLGVKNVGHGQNTGTPPVHRTSSWAFFTFAGFAILLILFRRRVMIMIARLVKRWHTMRQGRARGRYEEVIDLDERPTIY